MGKAPFNGVPKEEERPGAAPDMGLDARAERAIEAHKEKKCKRGMGR